MHTDRIRYKYDFNETEKANLAQVLANKQIEKIDLEEEKKAVASDFKAKIEAVTADINLHSRYVRDGWKFDYADCERKKNMMSRNWEWRHPDTGELLQTEPLKPHEMQGDIFDETE